MTFFLYLIEINKIITRKLNVLSFQVKGYSQSSLGSVHVPPHLQRMYERVWDEADYVVPPAENGAFFVTTNVVITPNQTLGTCPEVNMQYFERLLYCVQ